MGGVVGGQDLGEEGTAPRCSAAVDVSRGVEADPGVVVDAGVPGKEVPAQGAGVPRLPNWPGKSGRYFRGFPNQGQPPARPFRSGVMAHPGSDGFSLTTVPPRWPQRHLAGAPGRRSANPARPTSQPWVREAGQ